MFRKGKGNSTMIVFGKFRDALRIQKALLQKGIQVDALEAYDSWARYSLTQGVEWMEIKQYDKDETLYRKVSKHIQITERPLKLFQIKDEVERKTALAMRNLDSYYKWEFRNLMRYGVSTSNISNYFKAPLNFKS